MELNQNNPQTQPPANAGVPNLASLSNIPGMQNVQALQNMVEALTAQKNAVPAQQAAPAQSNPSLKKFDDAEISELSSIREAYEQLTVAFGQIEMQKRELGKTEKKLNEKYIAVDAQEKVFLDKIVAKYGEGTFDINTGVFTPKS